MKARAKGFWAAAGWVALGALLAWGAAWARGAAREGEERGGGGAAAVESGGAMPADVAFTMIALGGFRGLAADWLWSRASDLQDEGNYFELAQLSEWIARLQPHSPGIRAYHAWNLAYNLSAMAEGPEAKWRWVREGVRLLEEEGMRECPGSAVLHRELAWLFLHKIGGGDDEAGGYYRERWAEEAARRGGACPFPDEAAWREVCGRFPGLEPGDARSAAIYWAWTGLPFAKKRGEDVALRREIYQSLFLLVAEGRRELAGPAAAFVRDAAARHPENPALRQVAERLGGGAGGR